MVLLGLMVFFAACLFLLRNEARELLGLERKCRHGVNLAYNYCALCVNRRHDRPMSVVDLTRPGGGWIMCCICFEYRRENELFVDELNQKWDICAAGTCAKEAGMTS